MQVNVCLGAILIPEYLDSILEYILILEYSQTNAPLILLDNLFPSCMKS